MSLVLNNRRVAGKRFSCAELQTRMFYGYGTYEVRMRPAVGPGVVSAFFSYAGPVHAAGNRSEQWISIEFIGKNPQTVELNLSSEGSIYRRRIALSFDPSTTMADYAFQWMPDSLRWFANGELIHELKRENVAQFPSSPGKMFLSLRNGTGPDQEVWLGRFEYGGRPLLATYEYIAFTELGQPCQFPTSVVCYQHRPSSSPSSKSP